MNNAAECRSIPFAALVLGLAGLVPFGVAAVSQWIEVPHVSPAFGIVAAATYGAVILSFLGGIRWGTALKTVASRRQTCELLASVLSSLVGWLALLLSPIVGFSLLIAGFLLQALWDVLSVEKGYLPPWFGKLRMLLTAGAVLALFSILARLTVN